MRSDDQDKRVRRYWTTVELRHFRELYPYACMRELCQEFRRSRSAIKMMAVKLGLKKSPLYARVCFPEGHRPWNAGRKGWQAGGRARLTQFKKGHRGARQRPVGSERETRDGIEIKVAEPNVWIAKARFVWEQAFGPIPKGYLVRLRNPGLPVVENLMLVTRQEHVRLNWKPRGPKPLAPWLRQLVVAAEVA